MGWKRNDLKEEVEDSFNYAFGDVDSEFERYSGDCGGSVCVIEVVEGDEVVGVD